MRFTVAIVAGSILVSANARAEAPFDSDGPYTAQSQLNISITLASQTLSVDLYAPQNAPPAPILVAAHGLDGSKTDLSGWGTHLATWGFATAIPQFASSQLQDSPGNATYSVALLNWMQTQGAMSGTFYSGLVDGSRKGIFGHSMGGYVTYLAVGDDPSIQAALALDGIDSASDGMAAMGVAAANYGGYSAFVMSGSVAICNAYCAYEPGVEMAVQGPELVLRVTNSLHCDPEIPINFTDCEVACDDYNTPAAYTMTFLRYGTAWLRYALMCDSDALSYINGAGEQADLDAGVINSYSSARIGLPGGCPSPDAGITDGGVDGGEAVEADAGEHTATPEGCRCSGTGDWAPAMIVLLLGCLHRSRASQHR